MFSLALCFSLKLQLSLSISFTLSFPPVLFLSLYRTFTCVLDTLITNQASLWRRPRVMTLSLSLSLSLSSLISSSPFFSLSLFLFHTYPSLFLSFSHITLHNFINTLQISWARWRERRERERERVDCGTVGQHWIWKTPTGPLRVVWKWKRKVSREWLLLSVCVCVFVREWV